MLSIITVSYNSAKTIADTMKSVAAQSFKDFEHLVVDGLSKDNTLEIVQQNSHPNLKVNSGKDKGIYDAMNKGLNLASHEWVAFLNSDDFYTDEDVLKDVAQQLKQTDADILYADLFYVDQKNPKKITRDWTSGPFQMAKLKTGWHTAHPTFFARKSVLLEAGGFDLKYPIAADLNLMVKTLLNPKNKVTYLNRKIVFMREGGESNRGLKQILKANLECLRSYKENGLSLPFVPAILKPLRKILQLRFQD